MVPLRHFGCMATISGRSQHNDDMDKILQELLTHMSEAWGHDQLQRMEKLKEEVAELDEAIKSGNQEDIEDELGDVLAVLMHIIAIAAPLPQRMMPYQINKLLLQTYRKQIARMNDPNALRKHPHIERKNI